MDRSRSAHTTSAVLTRQDEVAHLRIVPRAKVAIPDDPPWHLRRPRLDTMIEQAVEQCAVVAVTAPAGFGKTTAVADALRDQGRPVAWIRLDEADRRAERAIQTVLAGLARAADADLETAAGSLDDLVARLGAAMHRLEAAGACPTVVLDDGGTALRAGAGQVLRLLVDWRPTDLPLVLLARQRPAIHAERLRVREQVHEIGADELAFTAAETADYLSGVPGVGADERTVRAIWELTEGWPAAVHLAAVGRGPDAFDHDVARRRLAVYVGEEVLADLRAEDRRRLTDTAVLPQLTPPLCDAVLGREGDAALARFVAAGLVVPVEQGRRFRHHGLLRQVLLAELHDAHPRREAILHGRAATWLATHEHWHGAVDQSLAAGDQRAALDLLEAHLPELLATGGPAWLRRTAAALPDHELGRRPALLTATLDLALLTGDRATIETVLAMLDESPRARDDGRPSSRRARAHLARLRGDSVDHLRQDPELRGPVDTGTAHTLGVALATDGYHDAARRALLHALGSADGTDHPLRALAILGDLAWERAAAGDLEEAELLCRRATRRTAELGLETPPAPAQLAQVQIAVDRGRPNAARQQATALRIATAAGHDLLVRVELDVVLANILLARGDVAGADRALARLQGELRDADAGAGARSRLARAHASLRLLLGDHERAADLRHGLLLDAGDLAPEDRLIAAQLAWRQGDLNGARHLLRGATAGAGPRLTVQALRLQSTLAGRLGQVAEARHLRQEAERLARAHGLAALLSRRPTRPVYGRSSPATAAVGVPVTRDDRRDPPFESLTERELAVLQRLPMWSNGEIAHDLHVSINTVKSHLKSIYRKLDVDSRTAAVRRARAVGLL